MRRVMQSRKYGTARRRERGVVSIIVALSLAVLIGMVGLALDLGKLYVTKSELQNSADACALAAALDLTGANSLSISEAAGMAAGHLNRSLFQSKLVTATVNNSVTYATSSSGPFQDKVSAAAANPLTSIKYVQCRASMSGIANWLIQALNTLPGNNIAAAAAVSATAVATTGAAQTTCAIPVFICDPSKFSPAKTYTIGQWLMGKGDSTTGTYNQGDFGWANLNNCNGQSCLSNQLTGTTCNIPSVGSYVRANGNIASLDKAYNSRFGIQYPGNSGGSGPSDFTGFSYTTTSWPAGSNAYNGTPPTGEKDFLDARKARLPYQGDGNQTGQSGLNTGGTPGSSTVYQGGADRRLPLAPMVDCNTVSSSAGAQVTDWACVLMLDPMQKGGNVDAIHLEYRGKASDPGSPCATQGTPGTIGALGPLVPELIQ